MVRLTMCLLSTHVRGNRLNAFTVHVISVYLLARHFLQLGEQCFETSLVVGITIVVGVTTSQLES